MDIQSLMSEHLYDVLFCSLTIIGGVIATFVLNKHTDKTHSYQLRAYIPTVWTSLGILFTFVSIYVSLLKYNGDDIMLLINNIVPAFSTSIICIAGAICTSISNKWKLAEDKKKMTMINLTGKIRRYQETVKSIRQNWCCSKLFNQFEMEIRY